MAEQWYKCDFCGGSERVNIRHTVQGKPACRECYEDAEDETDEFKRYQIGYYSGQGHESAEAYPHEHGEYVKYEDYAKLAARRGMVPTDEVLALCEAVERHKVERRDYSAWQHTYTPGQAMTHPVHHATARMETLAAALKQKIKEQPHE